MLRIMIVDDEEMICQLILQLVKWNDLGLEVVKIAHDGKSALEFITRENPDIVITDIRIPGYDGLELIKRSKELKFATKFIVISGYRQFEYAQRSLKYGVNDYLLKPINQEELNSSLKKLSEEITFSRKEQQLHKNITDSLTISDRRLRQQFLLNLISGNDSDLTMDIINNRFHYSLESRPFGLFVVKGSCSQINQIDLFSLIFNKVTPVLRSIFEPHCSTFEVVEKGSRLYCIYQFLDGFNEGVEILFNAIVPQFDEILFSFEAFSIVICPIKEIKTSESLSQAMLELEKSIAYRILSTHSNISDYPNAKIMEEPLRVFFSSSQESYLQKVLLSGNKERYRSALQQIFSSAHNILVSSGNPYILYKLCEAILDSIRKTPECSGNLIDLGPVDIILDNACTVSSLINGFTETLLRCLDPYFNNILSQKNHPIQLAIEYIEDHYAEQITLETVASFVNLSPAYLSGLFKKEVGASFSDYLTICRMNTAKTLLRHSSLTVTEISERIGYNDSKYFSKVFNKAFGISPQKYRSI